jgi:hypothetical protein
MSATLEIEEFLKLQSHRRFSTAALNLHHGVLLSDASEAVRAGEDSTCAAPSAKLQHDRRSLFQAGGNPSLPQASCTSSSATPWNNATPKHHRGSRPEGVDI